MAVRNSETDSIASSVRIGVEEIPVKPKVTPLRPNSEAQPASTPPPPLQIETRTIIEKPGVEAVLLAAFAALGYAVSARLILLLSVIGGFVLALVGQRSNSLIGLIIVAVYGLLVVCPLVLLEAGKVRKTG